jgi:hypothetical protein
MSAIRFRVAVVCVGITLLPTNVKSAGDPVKRVYVMPLQPVRNDWPVVEIADAGHFDCIVKKLFRDEIGNWGRKNSK